MSAKKSEGGPLGGIFSFLGGIVGAAFGNAIGGHWIFIIIGVLIGAWLGLIIEHIVFRLIVIALAIIMFIARQALFQAVRESFASIESSTPYEYAVTELSMHKYTFILTLWG